MSVLSYAPDKRFRRRVHVTSVYAHTIDDLDGVEGVLEERDGPVWVAVDRRAFVSVADLVPLGLARVVEWTAGKNPKPSVYMVTPEGYDVLNGRAPLPEKRKHKRERADG